MNLSNIFLRLAVVFALCGVTLGYVMGASQNFAGAPVHAHINLLGWVSMFLYGLFYRVAPQAASGWLPKAHLALAVTGFLIFMPALAVEVLMHGSSLMAIAGPGLILGPTLVLLGFVLFAVIIFANTTKTSIAATS